MTLIGVCHAPRMLDSDRLLLPLPGRLAAWALGLLMITALGPAFPGDALADRQCDDDTSFDTFDDAVTELDELFVKRRQGDTRALGGTDALVSDLELLSQCEGRLGRRALFYLARLHGLRGDGAEERDTVVRLRARQLSPEESKELDAHYPEGGTPTPASASGPPLIVATGVSFAPYYEHGRGAPRGFDVDLAEELARRLGRSGVEFASGRSVRARTRKGEADLGIAAITITEERRRETPFSRPYLTSEVVAVARGSRSLPSDLAGTRCSVNSGHALYVKLLKKVGCTVVGRDSHRAAMQAVLDGAADFTPRDVSAALLEGLVATGRVLDKDALGVAFPPEANELRRAVDAILADLEAEGWLLDRARRHGLELPADDGSAPVASPAPRSPVLARISDRALPVWIICAGAAPTRGAAEETAAELVRKGHPAGVLWIPDFESLSGAKMWLTFVGPVPYRDRDAAERLLAAVQTESAGAYGLRLDHVRGRESL